MTATTITGTKTTSVQTYARIAGVLLLVSLVAGGFGEGYVPSRLIVSGDAAATMRNIAANESFFRLGFASYLVEAVCDVVLSLVFYVLLRPVNNSVALLAAFFGLVSTAVFAVGELFFFAAPLLLQRPEYGAAFSAAQINALTLFAMGIYGYCGTAFLALYGIATLIRGYLIYKSTFLPSVIGVLLMLGGAGFIVRNLTFVLAPAYSSNVFLAVTAVAGLALTLWLLAKGVDAEKWSAMNER